MRRILILLLLGIICYSTFTQLMPPFPEIDKYKTLLDTVHGSVSAGNFTYWTFGQKGPLIIELVSLSGDADLFVGDSTRPSFEADRNNFSSETCGVDTVAIPEEFPRPIGIGVYGHWAHAWSDFSMKVFAERGRGGAPGAAPLPGPSAQPEKIGVKDAESKRQASVQKEEKPRVLKLFRVLDAALETVLDLVVL